MRCHGPASPVRGPREDEEGIITVARPRSRDRVTVTNSIPFPTRRAFFVFNLCWEISRDMWDPPPVAEP